MQYLRDYLRPGRLQVRLLASLLRSGGARSVRISLAFFSRETRTRNKRRRGSHINETSRRKHRVSKMATTTGSELHPIDQHPFSNRGRETGSCFRAPKPPTKQKRKKEKKLWGGEKKRKQNDGKVVGVLPTPHGKSSAVNQPRAGWQA